VARPGRWDQLADPYLFGVAGTALGAARSQGVNVAAGCCFSPGSPRAA